MAVLTEEDIRRRIAQRREVVQVPPADEMVKFAGENPVTNADPRREIGTEGPVAAIGNVVVGGPQRLADSLATRRSAAGGSEGALSALGQREGVPLDVDSGAGFMPRLTQNLAFNREEQVMLLKRTPGVKDVRFNSIGEPVLTVVDKDTGEERDILANPVGIDASDFAFVAANIPEMIGGMLSAAGKQASKQTVGAIQSLGRWLMSKDVAPSAGRMAVGGQLAGAAKDVVGRGLHPALEVEPGEIAQRRAVDATADFLFGVAGGVAGKATGRAVSPLSKRGPLQVNAEAAVELWRKKGVDLNLTPAEASGSRVLGRAESFMAQKPGSSAVFDSLMDQRQEAVGKIQNILLGSDPSLVPHADVVGNSVMQSLKADIAPLDFAVSREAQGLLRQATDDILNKVGKTVGSSTPVPESAVGARLTENAFKRLESFRAESQSLYSAVHGNPAVAGQGRNIDITPLANDAKKILSEVAGVEKTVEKPTGLLDSFGRPLAQEATETQALSSFVDGGSLAKLNQLASADGGQVSLRDLIELRRDIDDELFRGGKLTGLPERRLGSIRDAITQRIEGGLKELDDSGKLLSDFKKANDHYAENIRRFKEVDIVEMFKGPQDRGVLGLNQVVTRAISDPDRWRSYKDFFGDGSPEMTLMRRAFADRILGRLPGDTTIDASAFLSRLDSAFGGNAKEIATDVFGQSASQLRGLALAAKVANRTNVDLNELASLIDQKSLTADKLRGLLNAQASKDEAMKNSILAKIEKGIDGPDSIKPADFVNTVVFKSDPAELATVVSKIADKPELLDAVRQRTLMKVFSDSFDEIGGREMLSATKLAQFIDDPIMAKRLEPILGAETMRMLKATRDALKPGQVQSETFASSGRLAAASQIGTMERNIGRIDVMGAEIGRIAKSFLLASLYKTGPVRSYIANSGIKDRAAWVNSFIIAEPVVEDFFKVLGGEMGGLAQLTAMEMKSAIDADAREGVTTLKAPSEDDIRAMIRAQAQQGQTNQ